MQRISGLAFFDTETTGLDVRRHTKIIEAHVSRWDQAGDVFKREDTVTYWLSPAAWGQMTVSVAEALAFNHAVTRFQEFDRRAGRVQPFVSEEAMAERLNHRLRDRVVVGINPAFDLAMLVRALALPGPNPAWYHTPIDVRAVYSGRQLDRDEYVSPLSTADVAAHAGLELAGFEEHTAAGDVALAEAIMLAAFRTEDEIPVEWLGLST